MWTSPGTDQPPSIPSAEIELRLACSQGKRCLRATTSSTSSATRTWIACANNGLQIVVDENLQAARRSNASASRTALTDRSNTFAAFVTDPSAATASTRARVSTPCSVIPGWPKFRPRIHHNPGPAGHRPPPLHDPTAEIDVAETGFDYAMKRVLPAQQINQSWLHSTSSDTRRKIRSPIGVEP